MGARRPIGNEGKSPYYGGRPAIARISLRFIHDPSTTINQLLTNEVDATFFADASKIAALRAIPHHRIVVTPVPYFYTLSFNVTDPLAKDVAVRRAFALAIDRRALVAKVTHGLYDADTGMRGLFTWAFDPHADGPPYDPQRAQVLLARAGWVTGTDGIRVKKGRRLQLQLAFRTGSGVAAGFASLIVEDERAVGIEVTTKSYSPEEFWALDGPLSQGRFQVAVASYQSDYDPDASWLLSCDRRAPGGANYARYCDPAVDRALQLGVDGSTAQLGGEFIALFSTGFLLTYLTIFCAKSARLTFFRSASKDMSAHCSRRMTRSLAGACSAARPQHFTFSMQLRPLVLRSSLRPRPSASRPRRLPKIRAARK